MFARSEAFYAAAVDLDIGKEVTFKWQGFTMDQWLRDVQTRIKCLRIKIKQDELNSLEARVNALVSPEQRRAIELAKLMKEIK